jgi:hypothetical protein
VKHATGYEIYQVNLNKPRQTLHPDWHGPCGWLMGREEAKAAKKCLNKRYPGLYFFITKVG